MWCVGKVTVSFPYTHTPSFHTPHTPLTLTYVNLKAGISMEVCVCSGCVEGSVNVMGRKGGNRLFPTLTLTLTFHHPEQSLLHKLHWLDHVIRVGVFSVSECVARANRH